MRRLISVWCLVVLSAAAGSVAFGQAAAKPQDAAKVEDPNPKVALAFAPLSVPAATLTKSDFVYDERVPVLFYWGMVLPKRRMNFSAKDKTQTLKLGDSACAIELDAKRNFHLKAGKKRVVLKRTQHGLAAPAMGIGRGRQYQLALPRAFTYLGKGAIYYRSGCVQQGKLGEEGIALYDENLDGNYDRKGDFIRIGAPGDANVFAPIGQFVPTPSAVYKISNIARDGSSISLTRHAGDTGKIALACHAKGAEGHFAIASADGKLSFGAAARKQAFTVIPGKYKLLYGLLLDPKSKQVVALVVPGKMSAVDVAKIEPPPKPKAEPKPDPKAKPKPKPKAKPKPPPETPPTVMAFGEGAHLDFACKKAEGKVVVVGPVVVRGKLGEEYVGMPIGVRAYVVQGKQRIEIGRFTVEADGKPAEYGCAMPQSKDKKPLKGKWTLRLDGSVPGLGGVSGAKPIKL